MVKKGERVPYDGVLLTRAELATLLTEPERKLAGLKAELEAMDREHWFVTEVSEAKCKAEVTAEKAKTDACMGARVKESAIYEQALKKANDQPFWKSPTLMGILGLGAGAAICAAAR